MAQPGRVIAYYFDGVQLRLSKQAQRLCRILATACQWHIESFESCTWFCQTGPHECGHIPCNMPLPLYQEIVPKPQNGLRLCCRNTGTVLPHFGLPASSHRTNLSVCEKFSLKEVFPRQLLRTAFAPPSASFAPAQLRKPSPTKLSGLSSRHLAHSLATCSAGFSMMSLLHTSKSELKPSSSHAAAGRPSSATTRLL